MPTAPPRVARVLAACLLSLIGPSLAEAQTAHTDPTSQPPSWKRSWTVQAGTEWFSLRDISRAGTPMDGSPVGWAGTGPTVVLRLDREQPKRLIRAEITIAAIGHFSYDMGVRTSARPAEDRAFSLDGRYEQRWFFLRSLVVTGLDLGAGVQGRIGYEYLNRHVPPDMEFGLHGTRAGIGGVAAIRFHRWQRLTIEAALLNGGTIAWTTQHHTPSANASMSSWGGGWLTDLSVSATTPITRHASGVISYLGTGDGQLGSHLGFATARRHLMIGITYAR